jgi:hypothetical protein
MKQFVLPTSLLKMAILSLAVFAAAAEPSTGLKIASPKPAKQVWISHETGEVLKLVRADVPDEVVMAFIKNSKTVFSLSADEIIALHNEGVADEMIHEMLARKKQTPRPIIVTAPQPAAQPQVTPQQTIVQQAPPTVTYVQQPQTVYVPAPPTYVYRAPVYTYYDSYPYYYRSYGYAYPRVSFNFGFGHYWGHFGHHWGGHRHSGFHGRFRH